MAILNNNDLSISINEIGAELNSIIDQKLKIDFLWKGDSAIWGRKSPVLFPIVGRLDENSYLSGNQSYSLPQHGFARDMKFSIIEEASDKIVFSLVYDEATLKKYPYKFELQISYLLKGRKLTVEYKVMNRQATDLYFSLGAHPGFTCPVHENEKFEDYYLEFNKPETLGIYTLSNGLVNDKIIPFLKNEKKIPLSYELFKNDALIFKDYKSDFISLKHKEKGEVFKFHFAGYPFLGIWSKPGPFVCIEPWYGIADFVGHSGILEEKIGMQSIPKDGIFECEWGVEFN
jgi:galactose mutarotase-like enzyme